MSRAPQPEDVQPGHGLRVATDRGLVTVDVVADGIVRVRILDGEAPQHSYAIETDLPSLPAELRASRRQHVVATSELSVSVAVGTGALCARTASGSVIVEEPRKGYRRTKDGFRWQSRLTPDETCHGLAERSFGLSLRGRRYTIWNRAAGAYRPGDDPLYLNIPFYLGHRADLSYGIFWDVPARASLGLDVRGDGLLTFAADRRPLTMYLIVGADSAQVVRRFTGLVGRMELPPLWAIGFHHSRWGLRDADAFRAIAARMRAERIPCDVVHFDIDYMRGFRVFTWDRQRFPEPERLLAELRDQGFRSVGILDPGVKVDRADSTYREATDEGFFLTTASGGRLVRRVWAGRCEFPDFTDPACRTWWARQAATLAEAGFSGLWVDMNEPSTFDLVHTLPDATPHHWEGQGNTHVGGGHAVYGMQMARATRDGLVGLRPDRRPFVFSRAGYAGLQRFASSWNGDSRTTWAHLRMTIPQLLNLGLSGIAFSGSDAGGFQGRHSPELYLRWMQLAALTPFFRSHSTRRSPERHPWSHGADVTDRVRAVVNLRYRLLPYLYTAFEQASREGTPIMRPMFFEDPAATRLPHAEDQFMVGEHLLAAPIVKRWARRRRVALPAGGWYALDNNELLRGGRTITARVGLGVPVYVRAGAVIPTWPVVQHTGEPVDTLILDVYAGSATSHLYEDEGDGYRYRDGACRTSTFTTTWTDRALRVTWSRDGDFLPAYSQVVVRLLGLSARRKRVTVDGQPVTGERMAGVLTVSSGTFTTLEVR